ncbi:alcohol dehydrogenase, zinc-containing [Trichophyton violaceum]|uniref:Alcohol dehydrogenase, zinc-containing n=1 Tax=Trichophyton violaceum TaxID=34388 RepID=A0A178FII1_TRIVO|nr:alcohol dehydrogenase, zinc-containing [Trichophyton violaceum]
MATTTKSLYFKKIPSAFPEPGVHIAVENVPFDPEAPAPDGGLTLECLYTSFDPYMRGRMRPAHVKSYTPAYSLNEPIPSATIARVVKSKNDKYKAGDVVIGLLPIQKNIVLPEAHLKFIRPLENPEGLEDLRVFLGPLGMPGLTAYASLYEIGKPKKGETIFISSAAGAVGQVVGQIAKHEGLTVIGSVGSEEKLFYIVKTLGFDSGFNYKTEKPADALKRLAPNGIDIYFENVGGDHLEAALEHMNDFGRIVACGMISQYNLQMRERYPIKNLFYFITKRLTMRGFIVNDPGMGDKWSKEHLERVSKWIKDGSFKPLIAETVGIENAPEGLVGIFHGRNLGKAVLKL